MRSLLSCLGDAVISSLVLPFDPPNGAFVSPHSGLKMDGAFTLCVESNCFGGDELIKSNESKLLRLVMSSVKRYDADVSNADDRCFIGCDCGGGACNCDCDWTDV